MGNKVPSESKGCNCHICRIRLPPCKSFNDFHTKVLCGRNVFVFNGGKYYREVGRTGAYECSRCFFKLQSDQLQAGAQRQEEESKCLDEEKRKRQEEEEKKQSEVQKEALKQRLNALGRQTDAWLQKEKMLKENTIHRQSIKASMLAFDEFDKIQLNEDDGNEEGECNDLLEVLSKHYNCCIVSLDLGGMDSDLVARVVASLAELLFGDKATNTPKRVPLQHVQVFLIELLVATSDLCEEEYKMSGIADELQTFVAEISRSARDARERLLVSRSLFLLVLCTFDVHVGSGRFNLKMLDVAKVWNREDGVDGEELLYVNFLESLICYLQQERRCSSDEHDGGDGDDDDGDVDGSAITDPEKTCFKLLIARVLASTEMASGRETSNHIMELVDAGLWSPLEAIDVLHTLVVVAFPESPVIIAEFLHSLKTHRVAASWHSGGSKQGKTRLREHLKTSEVDEDFAHCLMKSFAEENRTSLESLIEQIRAQGGIDDRALDKTQCVVGAVLKSIEDNRVVVGPRGFKEAFLQSELGDDSGGLEAALGVLCTGVHHLFGWWPRETQMVSWCLLALSASGRLMEIGTGEGKSCVIAMFAVARALGGQKVDVVSSSAVLSERDAREWKKFYDLFGITVDTNTDKAEDAERRACYSCNVVYGTIESFAADHLRQVFEMKDIRPWRRFQCIVVDEVDFLLLDQGVQFTYLSNEMVGMQHLDPVLAMIWSLVSTFGHVPSQDGTYVRGPAMAFHVAAFNAIDAERGEGGDAEKQLENEELESPLQLLQAAEDRGLLPTGFITEISDPECKPERVVELLKGVNQKVMLEFMSTLQEYLPVQFTACTVDEWGMLQQMTTTRTTTRCNEDDDDDDDTDELDTYVTKVPILVLDEGLCSVLYDSEEALVGRITQKVTDKLHFTDSRRGVSKEKVNVPAFLETIVKAKLPTWVENAFSARKLEEGRQYLVKGDQIIPVDFKSTGVVQLSRRWGDGLQQFLEMKHQTKLSSLTAITNFISNVAFLEMYNGQLYGTSGTLGPLSDQKFLQKLYPQLSFCIIPPFKAKLLFESRGIVKKDTQRWLDSLCSVVTDEVSPKGCRKGRAALVICEDINKARRFHEAIEKHAPGRVSLYCRNDDEGGFDISTQELCPGDVVVATNLAGRGTDVKVTREVEAAGGLFVVLAFLAQNERVERQAFGRTARKGQPGSALIIACIKRSHSLLGECTSLNEAKRVRDSMSIQHMEHVLEDDVPEVRLMERLFVEYCSIKRSVHGKIADPDRRDVAVAVLNEYWGMWLQIKARDIKELKEEELLRNLRADLEAAKLNSADGKSPSHNVHHFVNFGNAALIDGRQSEAMELYKKAITMDHPWAAIAYYNHAYCVITIAGKSYLDWALKDLSKAQESLMNFQEQHMLTSQFVQLSGCVKPSKKKKHEDEEMSQFALHFQVKGQVLDFFKKNIAKATKKLTEIKSAGQDAVATESSVFSLGLEAGDEVHRELYELQKLGLQAVFSVKKKPRFCWEGLLVFLLGVLQIIAGVLLMAVSAGFLSNVGMGLIAEGIGDCIQGGMAMAKGEFSWESWAAEKACSIAISLIAGGIGKVISRGVGGTLKALKAAGKELRALPKVLKNHIGGGLSNAIKTNVQNAVKYVSKEMVEQSLMYGVSKAEDAAFKKCLEDVEKAVKESTLPRIKYSLQNGELGVIIDNYLLSNPDLLSEPDGTRSTLERIKNFASVVLDPAFSGLEWQNKLSGVAFSVIAKAKGEIKSAPVKVLISVVNAVHIGALTHDVVATVGNLQKGFEPSLCECIERYMESNEDDVERLGGMADGTTDEVKEKLMKVKEEIAEVISQELSSTVIQVVHQKLLSHLATMAKDRMDRVISRQINSGLNTQRTRDDLRTGENALYIGKIERGSKPKDHDDVASVGLRSIEEYAKKIAEPQTCGSLLDVRILSEEMGIRVVISTETKGKLRRMHMVEPSDGTLAKTVHLVYRMPKPDYPNGHYDVIVGGKITKVENESSNCLYHVMARGLRPGADEGDVAAKARELRATEAALLKDNGYRYEEFVQRKMWMDEIQGDRLLMAEGGASKKKVIEIKKKMKDAIAEMLNKRLKL